jgi:pimeloyl-ACP methyl ester carboxylesterase
VDTLIDVGGQRLHFRVWPGTGDLTVVFQAGGGSDLSAWSTVPALAAERTSRRVVAYDRAGLGQSDVGPICLSPEMELDQLDRALDGLGVGRIVLVGHSYGGLLALVHATRRADRVAGLVLVDPMNSDFIETMGLAWLNGTVPEVTNPASARDTVVFRMRRTIEDLFERGRGTPPAAVPTIVITAGIPWWGSAGAEGAWRQSHETLARRASRNELVVAAKSRHGIPGTEPEVVVGAVARMVAMVSTDR